MPRPKKRRIINFSPQAVHFKPAGIPLREIEEIIIAHEELEAMRLKNLLEQNQEEAARQMDISQPTFHRLVTVARKKIVDALVNGKAIKIEGGHYIMKENKTSSNTIIAISSASKDLEGDIDNRFGRCQYFLIVSIDNGNIASFEFIENVKSEMRGGVGIAVAQMLANHGINAVISGNIGPRAMDVLKEFEIPAYQASGSKREAIEDFVKGKCNLL